jgi:hypothetical protein
MQASKRAACLQHLGGIFVTPSMKIQCHAGHGQVAPLQMPPHVVDPQRDALAQACQIMPAPLSVKSTLCKLPIPRQRSPTNDKGRPKAPLIGCIN